MCAPDVRCWRDRWSIAKSASDEHGSSAFAKASADRSRSLPGLPPQTKRSVRRLTFNLFVEY